MYDILNVHSDELPDEIPDLHPYPDKIYCIQLDKDQRHILVVINESEAYRFKGSLSYWVKYFNRKGCRFDKAHRDIAINLDKLTGYGRDNAILGSWWVVLDSSLRFEISKTFYNHLNKTEYRTLNKSIKIRKPTS